MSPKRPRTGTRLWDKGAGLNELVLEFTVDQDPGLDLELVEWDALASAAHARMLGTIGVLSASEVEAIVTLLQSVWQQGKAREFSIKQTQEDVHTAIEAFLVENLGEAGKKIHTGRSRNDQVLVALRLYARERTIEALERLDSLAGALFASVEKYGSLPMPGYTHMQPAMPVSVGMWLHSFIEQVLEVIRDGLRVLEALGSNPLGVASGFGVPLVLNREFTAKLLGFDSVQRSPIATQNSRSKDALRLLRQFSDMAAVLERFASDSLLFSTLEFAFVELPETFTTGSSIMPQKKNYDVLELLRATASRVRAAEGEVSLLGAKLPSSYHRDYQFLKAPLFRAVNSTLLALRVFKEVVDNLTFNEARLKAAMGDELYATYDTYRRVRNGIPFREAYRITAEVVSRGELRREELVEDFALVEDQFKQELSQAHEEYRSLSPQIANRRTQISSLTAVFDLDED